MNKRLILHIGIHRTGTTSIQGWLHANREALRRQGVRYALGRQMHTDLAWSLHSGKLRADRFINDLVADAAGDDIHTLVVSGEDFAMLRQPEMLVGLADHFDVTVVCYLRRQDHWLESWYNQHVKWPWDRELSQCDRDEFLARRSSFYWIDYAALLDRWGAAFGQDRIVARAFERGRFENTLEEDFAAICDIDAGECNRHGRITNDSAPPQAIEFLRHLRLSEKHGPARLVLVRTVVNVFRARGLDTVRHFWSERERRAIVDEYSHSNEQVATKWLGAADGEPLFQEPLPGEDETRPDIDLPPLGELFTTMVNPVTRRVLNKVLRAQETLSRQAGAQAGRFELARRVVKIGIGYFGRFIPGAGGHADRQLYALIGVNRLPPRQQHLLINVLEATRADRLSAFDGNVVDLDDPVDVMRCWVEPVLTELANRYRQAREAQQALSA